MLKITETEVFGWKAAIRGMRNAHESWDKSDSCIEHTMTCFICPELKNCPRKEWKTLGIKIGPNDLTLMKKLVAAGTDHSKFMRMIHVQCDWEAPLYWWKEADTYKVGTVRNSCSTMHKIAAKEFTLDDFSHDHLFNDAVVYNGYVSTSVLECVIGALNEFRNLYLETKDKRYWWQMIQLLPSNYNQKATMDLNYQVLRNMYHSRKNHKQDEWRVDFCNWVKSLPYSELIIMTKEELLESIKGE